MATEKTTAIVLRVTDFSETSKVVTLYTRDFGKITGLAKGAYRRNGPFESALDLLSLVQVVFIQKPNSSLDLLTEAKLERRFKSASINLERLHYGFYLIEVLAKFTEESDPNPRLFDLAIETLNAIDGDSDFPQIALANFELQMLAMLGHAPMLSQCVGCGRPAGNAVRKYFGTLEGGLYCSACRVGKKSVINLSPEAWSLLDALSAYDDPGVEMVAENREPFRCGNRMPAGFPEVRGVLNQFVSHLLGKPPRLQGHLSATEN
ncbi:MAG: DNA repair protein RecO [Pirellulaceae bacterium]|nr:DNA repair protein RecO [Pirellulaceae bacterium]